MKSLYSLSQLAFHHFAHHSLISLSQYLQYRTDISANGLQVALELGSYIGYSAITQARKLPAGGKLYGIELDATNARITQEMVQHAGLSHKVEILKGNLESSILVGLLTQHMSMSCCASCTSDAKHSRSTLSLLATRPQDQRSMWCITVPAPYFTCMPSLFCLVCPSAALPHCCHDKVVIVLPCSAGAAQMRSGHCRLCPD